MTVQENEKPTTEETNTMPPAQIEYINTEAIEQRGVNQ